MKNYSGCIDVNKVSGRQYVVNCACPVLIYISVVVLNNVSHIERFVCRAVGQGVDNDIHCFGICLI